MSEKKLFTKAVDCRNRCLCPKCLVLDDIILLEIMIYKYPCICSDTISKKDCFHCESIESRNGIIANLERVLSLRELSGEDEPKEKRSILI